MSCGYNCEYSCEECDVPDKVIEFINGYNQALDDAIEFFMNHIHSNNNDHVVKNYVCKQLEKMKK